MGRRLIYRISFIFIFYSLSLGNFRDLKIGLHDLLIGVKGEYEEDETYIFGNIADIQIDDEDRIYLLDNKICKIQVYDEKGKFIKSIGGRGQGPGEFNLPSKFFIINKKIFVLDFRSVNIFSIEGQFIKSFKVDFQATDIKVNRKNEIILLGLRNDKIFHIFDLEGNLLHSFGEPFKIPSEYYAKYKKYEDCPFLKVHVEMFLIDEDIYIFNPFRYKIRYYKNNQFIKDFGRETSNYNTPVVTDFGSMGYSIGYIGSPTILKLNKNILLICFESKIDIFENYKFLKTITSKNFKGLAKAIDRKNRIYCIDSFDYPKIIRYPLILK